MMNVPDYAVPTTSGRGEHSMATKEWVLVSAKRCDLLGVDVELREQRLYPTSDFLRARGNEYRVRACSCTSAIACNMAGISCRWAYTNPDNDRF
jgi:hypothetical protein